MCATPTTPEILEKTSQNMRHPRDTGKSWKYFTKCAPHRDTGKSSEKPHKMSATPGTPEKPGRTSQSYAFLVVVGCWRSGKLCRGPLRGQ